MDTCTFCNLEDGLTVLIAAIELNEGSYSTAEDGSTTVDLAFNTKPKSITFQKVKVQNFAHVVKQPVHVCNRCEPIFWLVYKQIKGK